MCHLPRFAPIVVLKCEQYGEMNVLYTIELVICVIVLLLVCIIQNLLILCIATNVGFQINGTRFLMPWITIPASPFLNSLKNLLLKFLSPPLTVVLPLGQI